MEWLSRASRHLWAMVVFVLLLLVVLAALQYRWTGELSRAEGQRMQALLESSTRHIADDLNREVTRVFVAFQPDAYLSVDRAGPAHAAMLAQWNESAPYPRLVRDIFMTERSPDGSFRLTRLDVEAAHFEEASWPPALESLRRGLEHTTSTLARDREEILRVVPLPLNSNIPAVVLPFEAAETATAPTARPGEITPAELQQALSVLIIVHLDLEFLRDSLLPTLVDRYLGQSDYDVAVVVGQPPETVVFQSDPGPSIEHFKTFDVETPLFALLPGDELRSLRVESEVEPESRSAGGARRRGFRWASLATTGVSTSSGWRLGARHHAGSLHAVIARSRARNLAIVFAILVLLGVSVALVFASSRRARELADRHLEFVAGVSHELRTPLAAIRSLSQNLSDGLIKGEEQARRYGASLEREEERLSRMVEQVLEFASWSPGQGTLTLQSVDLRTVVEQVLTDAGPVLEEYGTKVDLDLPQEPAQLVGDPDALARAVQNLITNAAKFGGNDRWVGIGLTAGDGEGRYEIHLSVSDHGRGISRDDRGRIFEPFFRSREAQQAQIPGSGLGLSLVKRIVEEHNGRIEVRSAVGEGTEFTICLPSGSPTTIDEQTDPPG